MALGDDLISVEEASILLHVSVQHVRRLVDSGELSKVARGLIDRKSLDRYQLEHRQSRTRVWAEHTAWGAMTLLSGHDANWLGATQASRVRRTLREMTEPAELIARTRDRARVHSYTAHTAALPRLRDKLAVTDLATLGIVDSTPDSGVDGYLATEALDSTVKALGLRADAGGNVTIRVTSFDFAVVSHLIANGRIVAAVDAAISVNPRIRGVGERALADVLDAYR